MTMTLSPVAVMGVAIASGDNRGQLILGLGFSLRARFRCRFCSSAFDNAGRHPHMLVDTITCNNAAPPSCLPRTISDDREIANVTAKIVNTSHFDVVSC